MADESETAVKPPAPPLPQMMEGNGNGHEHCSDCENEEDNSYNRGSSMQCTTRVLQASPGKRACWTMVFDRTTQDSLVTVQFKGNATYRRVPCLLKRQDNWREPLRLPHH
ncbi:hypothetical protein P7K49_010728 [Saguinus oedipus]|uniref:Uncharacterized protein n=1 Tax=Saguinus oedipus TaxID=9490 RepID=A0ABQ9VP09_SAGOE|nr:hypothetical protein P7K49_010728 [Saguinus oedipus]